MNKVPFSKTQDWLCSRKANQLTHLLLEKLEWEQPKIKIYGKEYFVPRLTTFLADRGISYSYSGIKHIGKDWPNWFTPLLEKIQGYCKTEYNGCLINLYRNGNDCMGWHADNEEELDNQKSIASLSLGSTRDFLLSNRINKEKKSFSLSNGDLFIMEPECQFEWIHSIPRRKKVKDLRINLTFRCYK
ncbi:alpha-ketoglutarate-dependent dioxygenase AlkB family protein [Prochlorococcus marinus]|uniref:alpha-ketoglutarate-dependent dioxygenase AlkB family protein n=1 Tax=Prochlorococcus marinus TaxID=1219 RepID=UPI0022B48683|nr:alpha-ketoglutarate-dependent dioxygenase AlkB [Prochlorococcus marinus]